MRKRKRFVLMTKGFCCHTILGRTKGAWAGRAVAKSRTATDAELLAWVNLGARGH